MADDPNPDPNPDDDKPDPERLGEPGKKALEDERRARRDAEKKLKDAADRLKELEDRDKSETQRLTDRVAVAEKDAATARAELLRLSVGTAKGLTVAQAKRLVGSSQEELEADADELLESFGTPNGENTPRPVDKPRERLSGGGDPTEEPEVDIRKMVDDMPRGF